MYEGADTLGERIRKLREARGWSQRKLAQKASSFSDDRMVSNVTINNIESGKTLAPGIDVLAAIARALDVEVASLLEAEETRPTPPSQEELVRQLSHAMSGISEQAVREFAGLLARLSAGDQELLVRLARLLSLEERESSGEVS